MTWSWKDLWRFYAGAAIYSKRELVIQVLNILHEAQADEQYDILKSAPLEIVKFTSNFIDPVCLARLGYEVPTPRSGLLKHLRT